VARRSWTCEGHHHERLSCATIARSKRHRASVRSRHSMWLAVCALAVRRPTSLLRSVFLPQPTRMCTADGRARSSSSRPRSGCGSTLQQRGEDQPASEVVYAEVLAHLPALLDHRPVERFTVHLR
jgi:hypothetical protein